MEVCIWTKWTKLINHCPNEKEKLQISLIREKTIKTAPILLRSTQGIHKVNVALIQMEEVVDKQGERKRKLEGPACTYIISGPKFQAIWMI